MFGGNRGGGGGAFQSRKDNSGVLYENRMKKSEKSADAWGYLTVEGREYKISAWNKTSPKGDFLSLAIEPKQEAQARQGGYAQPPQRQAPPPRQAPPRYEDRRNPPNDYYRDDPGPGAESDYGIDPSETPF